MKDGGIYYSDESSLYEILNKFDPKFYEEKDNDHYKNYNPDDVMKIFKNVFIDEVVKKANKIDEERRALAKKAIDESKEQEQK